MGLINLYLSYIWYATNKLSNNIILLYPMFEIDQIILRYHLNFL